MKITNYVYKLKKEILPFKTAIIAVVISVVASVGVSVVSDTGKNIISDEMRSMGLNGLAAAVYNNNGVNITDINFYNDISSMSDTENVTPIIINTSMAKFSNGKELEVMEWGINNKADEVFELRITAGRMINNKDIESNSRVCLVDEGVARTIYKRDNICGKYITVDIGKNMVKLRIIGIVKKGSSILNALTGDVVPNFIYIPYTTMKNLSDKSAFDQIIFTSMNDAQSSEEFKNKLEDISYKYSNKIVKLTNLAAQKKQIYNIVDTAFLSLFMVSGVAILVCSISVASSVNTAVISRQKDIGIKMSMGASCTDITIEFLSSAIISCFIGISVAVVIVIMVVEGTKLISPISLTMDGSLIALSISVTIVLTIIFSFMPSYHASKMPPIKALNRE